MHVTRSLRLVAALVAAATALVAIPLNASAVSAPATSRSFVGKVTLTEMRARGVSGAKMLQALVPAPAAHIKGKVELGPGDREDARPYVLGLMSMYGEWFPVTGSDVASDGTYTLPLPPAEFGVSYPADIRVGFFDGGGVYRDSYYSNAATLESATDITVAKGATVTGIDGTMTAYPQTIFSGKVRFSEGPTPTVDPAWAVLFHFESDPYWGGPPAWEEVGGAEVQKDGTYRIHPTEAGTYRIGFFTDDGVFSDVFYKDASTVEKATDVTITMGSVVSGLDQTMTATPVRRVGGKNRYETAVNASKASVREWGVDRVVLATGENWPDALVAGPYAANSGAQLLLTKKKILPAAVAEEIRRLEPMEVVIIGGLGAVSIDVEMALRSDLGIPVVRRIQGRDRYSTSAQVADEMMNERAMWEEEEEEETTPTAVVVTGEDYADALSATPLAAAEWAPLLLTRSTGLPASVASFMDRREIAKTYVVGGAGAVGTSVARSLSGVTRLSGKNRLQTAVAVARHGMDNELFESTTVGLASSRSFADGVIGGAASADQGSALLFSDPRFLSDPTAAFVDERKTIGSITVYGGETAVSPAVVSELERSIASR